MFRVFLLPSAFMLLPHPFCPNNYLCYLPCRNKSCLFSCHSSSLSHNNPLSFYCHYSFTLSPHFGKFPSHSSTPYFQELTNTFQLAIQIILNIPFTPTLPKEALYCLIIQKELKSDKTEVWEQMNFNVVLVTAGLLWLENFKVNSGFEWAFSSTQCSTTCIP